MRSTFLENAEPAGVSHAVRAVLEARGALVREHVSTRVRFTTRPHGWSWTRSGYVGLYQNFGEKDVEVRLVLRARWPHRILWGSAAIVLLACILTFIVNPEGTTWFVVAFLGALTLLVATLIYVNTWRPVRAEEHALMDAFEAELQVEGVGAAIEREEERELRRLEAELEGEVERRRVERDAKLVRAEEKAKPKAPKAPRARPKLNLAIPRLRMKDAGRKEEGNPESKADAEARRAELLARKAELEREQREE